MAQLSIKEQRELNKLIKENEVIQNKINSGTKVQNRTLEKQEQIQKRILALEEKRDAMSQDQRDVQKEANKLLEQMDKKQRILNLSADKFKSLKSKTYDITQNILSEVIKHNKETGKGTNLLNQQVDAINDIVGSAGDLESLKSLQNEYEAELNKAMQENNESLQDHYNLLLKVVKAKKDEVEETEQNKDQFELADDFMGGILSKAMDLKKGKFMALAIGAAVVLMKQLSDGLEAISKTADSIGEALGGRVLQQFGPQLGMASARAKRFGMDVGEVNTIVTTLNSNFGFTIKQTEEVLGRVTNLSRALGVSVTDGATLLGLFGRMSGNTNEVAEGILSTVDQLAEIEGIAPNAVLSDIANNAEFFAKFSKDGGRNIAETAIQARKLGLSLSTVEGMMSDSTDIAGSLTKEYEAELFLGKDINVERLRFLKVSGSAEEILAEQRKILEDINFLGIEDRLVREKVADLLGASVTDLTKIATAEAKRVETNKKLSELDFKDLIGKDAMSNLTNFNNSMAELGAILQQTIIPPLTTILGYLASFINYISESPALLGALTGALVTLGTLLGAVAIKGIASAIAGAFAMIGGFAGLGPLGIIAGMAAIGGFLGFLKSSVASPPTPPGLQEGGLVKSKPGGGMFNIGEGGEDELVTPLSKVGQLINVDTKPMSEEIATLKGEIAKTNQAMSTLISNMESYFGFGGSAVKGIGRETIKAGSSLL